MYGKLYVHGWYRNTYLVHAYYNFSAQTIFHKLFFLTNIHLQTSTYQYYNNIICDLYIFLQNIIISIINKYKFDNNKCCTKVNFLKVKSLQTITNFFRNLPFFNILY